MNSLTKISLDFEKWVDVYVQVGHLLQCNLLDGGVRKLQSYGTTEWLI